MKSTKYLVAIAMLALMNLLAGCATSSGPKFSGLDPVPQDKASIYVYRNSALFAVGQAFTVNLDGKSVGQLYNASYLHIPVAPGKHTVQVVPGGRGQKISTREVTAEAGTTMFFEYDFAKGPFANVFFVGAEIEPRDADKALADLKALQRAE